MANSTNNNLLGNQRRRNFIYSAIASHSREGNALGPQSSNSAGVVHAQSVVRTSLHQESPHKKFKSSHGSPGKREDEIAAEEACRDLPLDVFDDDEFYTLDDDLDDNDLLTAEQLRECDRLASSSLYPQQSICRGTVTSSSRVGPDKSSDENHEVKCIQDHVSFVDSRVSHANSSIHPLVERDPSLNLLVDQPNGTVSARSSDIGGNNLKKEYERLKTELAAASTAVKRLEEDKFCKDGEIKMLRDSLSDYQAEEKRRQAEKKAVDERQAKEQSDRERELLKQVENLTTQIRFKEREISQMMEQNQNKKRTASLSVGSSHSPKRKLVNLSEAFPTGNSFFQKTSPESKVKSPRMEGMEKEVKTQSKQNSPRLSEGDTSENTGLSGFSSSSSTVDTVRAQRRDNCASEIANVQLLVESFPEVELVQNLLLPQEKEQQFILQEQDGSGSILSLPTNCTNVYSTSSILKTFLNERDVTHTLRLFETQAASILPKSISGVTQKDSLVMSDGSSVMQTLSGLLNYPQMGNNEGEEKTSNLVFKDRHLPAAVKFLPLLENHIADYVHQKTERSDENIVSTSLPRSSPTNDSAESRESSLLESEHAKKLAGLQRNAQISLRLLNVLVMHSHEVCECILMSARVCGDSDEISSESVLNTIDDIAKIFSSKEKDKVFIQYPLFSSIKIATRNSPVDNSHISSLGKMRVEASVETGVAEKIDDKENIYQTELLGYMFMLLMPQPNNSVNVAYYTLQVLNLLARDCELKFLPRMLPLLTENLLSQCLSQDWTLGTLSLVTSLLTLLMRHSCFRKRLCSQSDDCILLKIYQGWLFKPADPCCQEVHLKICTFVNNLLKNSDSLALLFPLESECQCNLELIKCLVLMLDRELNSLSQVPSEALTDHAQKSHNLMLLRQGVFLLSMLCLNDRMFVEHRAEVEHQYVNVVSCVTRLYKQIVGVISEAEVFAVQELVDFEHIYGIEWSQESDDEDETVEGMEVAE
ncbi:ATR-interacting protein-like isoform X2 [Stylophora pistillata]|uniref:ATR-interacting protein n=1 Tax=Stylophora pistillata TaxID=50429 RepID=A0A2B4S5E7_STYPI|nr:ATR-interacting protein-like isoform X2 [Stylophora pistillata]PFX24263.1 ATR-interacting protein [Stylophora pistillata]